MDTPIHPFPFLSQSCLHSSCLSRSAAIHSLVRNSRCYFYCLSLYLGGHFTTPRQGHSGYNYLQSVWAFTFWNFALWFSSEWVSVSFTNYYINGTTSSLWTLFFILLYLSPSFSLPSAQSVASSCLPDKWGHHLVSLSFFRDRVWRLPIISSTLLKHP